MNAVDITARGLASRALGNGDVLASPSGAESVGTADGYNVQDFVDRVGQGTANIRWRSGQTAAALEDLADRYGALTGFAGDTHTVETAPFVTRDNLVIRGNGATLRNTNATALNVDDISSCAIFLGTSNLIDTERLTYYAVSAASGTVLTSTGNGGSFAVGDPVVIRGASSYTTPNRIFRNKVLATVLAQTPDTITIDRTLPAELLADSPVIANANEGLSSAFVGAPGYHISVRPKVSNMTFASDTGSALQACGVIDGVFRDISQFGRNGFAGNALQDTLVDGLRFSAWRKGIELAEGSFGTTIRNVRGWLSDASAKFGGGSDACDFFIAIDENSAQCRIEDIQFDSGPNDVADPVNDSAVMLATGRDNAITDFVFRLPALTGNALAVQSNGTESADRMTYERGKVYAPGCKRFVVCNVGAGGLDRPRFRNLRFYGTPTSAAALLAGTNGLMERVIFENGIVSCSSAVVAMTGWRIEECEFPSTFTFPASFTNNKLVGNYIAGGFANLTDALLETNDIRDNDNDANRRLRAAATISNSLDSITTTTANSVYRSSTFAAGDLALGDKVFFSVAANASSSGGGGRTIRPSVTVNGTTIGLGAFTTTTASEVMSGSGWIRIDGDTSLTYDFVIGGTWVHGVAIVASISTFGLTFNLEAWVTANSFNIRQARIIPIKPGMAHLDLS